MSLPAPDTEALTLAERVIHQPGVRAERLALTAAYRPRIRGQVTTQEFAKRALADEADTGAVFLVMDLEARVTRNRANLALLPISEREDRLRQGLGADGVQEIALVLVAVSALPQSSVAADGAAASIMAGGQQVAAKTLGMLAKDTELDLAIAEYVRIRRAACAVLVQKIAEHLVPVLPREIDVVQRDVELLADETRVLQVFGRRAIAVVVLPVGHVQCVHVGAGPPQQNRCDRRIDAAGQPEDYPSAGDLLEFCRGHRRRILMHSACQRRLFWWSTDPSLRPAPRDERNAVRAARCQVIPACPVRAPGPAGSPPFPRSTRRPGRNVRTRPCSG